MKHCQVPLKGEILQSRITTVGNDECTENSKAKS